jgi:hypothetical protein
MDCQLEDSKLDSAALCTTLMAALTHLQYANRFLRGELGISPTNRRALPIHERPRILLLQSVHRPNNAPACILYRGRPIGVHIRPHQSRVEGNDNSILIKESLLHREHIKRNFANTIAPHASDLHRLCDGEGAYHGGDVDNLCFGVEERRGCLSHEKGAEDVGSELFQDDLRFHGGGIFSEILWGANPWLIGVSYATEDIAWNNIPALLINTSIRGIFPDNSFPKFLTLSADARSSLRMISLPPAEVASEVSVGEELLAVATTL